MVGDSTSQETKDKEDKKIQSTPTQNKEQTVFRGKQYDFPLKEKIELRARLGMLSFVDLHNADGGC